MGLSAQTGTGFSNLDVGALGAGAKLALMGAMLVGGALGSTTGGIKLLRALILLRLLQLMVLRTRLPHHAVAQPRIGREVVQAAEIERALLVIVLFFITVGLSWLPFLVLDHPPVDALFEVVSATATVGLSSGVTGTGLAPGLKLVLAVDMLLGRVEFLALLVVLYPGTWLGRRNPAP